jgi:hypothetical protein
MDKRLNQMETDYKLLAKSTPQSDQLRAVITTKDREIVTLKVSYHDF